MIYLLAAMIVLSAAQEQPRVVGDPIVRDLGTVQRVTGTIAGLGRGDVFVSLESRGVAQVQCRTPEGYLIPGRTTAVAAGGSSLVPLKNGQVRFSVTTRPVIVAGACAHPSWTAVVVDVVFSGGTVTAQWSS